MPFESKNVAEDDSARAELIARTGRIAVPVIVVGDEVVTGFDRGRLQRLGVPEDIEFRSLRSCARQAREIVNVRETHQGGPDMRAKAVKFMGLGLAILAFLLLASASAIARHTKEADSTFDFEETVSKVKAAIEAQGFTIVTTVDYAAALKNQGAKKVPGMVMIEFFHPKQLKDTFEGDHAVVIELPWRLVIVEGAPDDPHSKYTHINYVKPAGALGPYKKLGKQAEEWDAAIEKVIGSVRRAGGH